ncbi:MAG: hypothetical protein L3K19_00735 [Thermoplasmata archaeon]|nr:hypothetical protein [Thermoplasmata archaeon]
MKTPGGWGLSTASPRIGFGAGPAPHAAGDVHSSSQWSSARAIEVGYWLAVLLVTGVAALALFLVFRENALPPGGDPGNWLATALAFIGRPFPTQVIPFAYPPVTFPVLGLAVVVAGPVTGVALFAVALMVALGLSTAALAATLLRSRLVAFLVVVFLLADPSLLGMFFWGAYPNLLGFVWMNLALVGLLRAGQGRPSAGAAQFWVFFTLAALTHSLVGAVLALTTALYLGLGLGVPLPSLGALVSKARHGALEAPGLAARALFASRGGQGGMVLFGGLVGGYYALTAIAGVPHPSYLATDANGFGVTSLTGALNALLPGAVLPGAFVVAFLVLAAFGAALLYAIVRDRRPAWLTAPAVLLLAWPLAVTLLILGGFAARVVTDYRRFGYFYLIPAGLAAGYLVERTWVLGPGRRRPTSSGAAPGDPTHLIPVRRAPGGPPPLVPPPFRRPAVCAAIAMVILLVVLDTATLPGLAREETTFTQIGHDAAFLQALHAIQRTGVSGAIVTVPGADKWVRGLTGENAFAPYATNALLFYPSQQLDSELTYYSLSSHYAVTNGHVAASVRGTAPSMTGGIPDYSVYESGTLHELLRLPPTSVAVRLHAHGNGTLVARSLTATPGVFLPAQPTGPMGISYEEPDFWFNVSVTLGTSAPYAVTTFLATARGAFSIAELDVTATPPAGSTALAWPNVVAGDFLWSPAGDPFQPVTYGNVTPASAFRGATDFDPASGGPAALLAFVAPNPNGSASIGGQLNLTTPVAAFTDGASPGSFDAPAIWSTLGARFVLWWNASASSASSVLPATEAGFLTLEYGLRILYENAEWVALEIPGTLSAAYGSAPSSGLVGR